MADVGKLLLQNRPASSLRKETYHKKQLYQAIYDNIIKKGIVVAVDYYGNKNIGVAPYSLKIRVDKTFDNKGNERWFEPLLPIHNIVLPEVGEEVWLIYVTAGDASQGFWVSRVNNTSEFSNNSFKNIDTSELTKLEATKIYNENQMWGVNGNKEQFVEKSDIEPSITYNIPVLRIKPGDVVSHGRSNTHVIHSFDTKNKKGVIDIVTEIDKAKKKFYEQEYHISKGARFLAVTLSNVDNLIIRQDLEKEFHTNFGQLKEDSFAFIQANQIRLISQDSKKDINHVILAEYYKDWMTKLVNKLKTDINELQRSFEDLRASINSYNTTLNNHTHLSAAGPTILPVESVSLIPANADINTKFTNVGNKLVQFNTDLQERLDNLSDETFSKNIACN